MLLSLLLIRMIEDCGQSGDTMADRRQLLVEMSKCSGLRLTVICAGLFSSVAIKLAIFFPLLCKFHVQQIS